MKSKKSGEKTKGRHCSLQHFKFDQVAKSFGDGTLQLVGLQESVVKLKVPAKSDL